MKATDFLSALAALPSTDATGQGDKRLLKEVQTLHIGGKAVHVTASQLDLDTDGGNNPSIHWDSTHQSDTSLHWPHGSPVDANATRFIVLPLKWRHGIRLGDVGLACIRGCDDVVAVIAADLGPPRKLGEGSIALHRALGREDVINGHIHDVGMGGPFHMLLFVGSGDGVCHSNDENEAKALALWEQLVDQERTG